jgi:hypothetical protein
VNHRGGNAGGVIGFTSEGKRDAPIEKDDSHAPDGLESFSLSAAAIGWQCDFLGAEYSQPVREMNFA